MSRKGKLPVSIPKDAKVTISGSEIQAEGPKGKLNMPIPHGIKVEQKDNEIVVSRSNDVKQNRANHGTVRALLENVLTGVTKGHKKDMEIHGVGFRAQAQGSKLVMNLGFSHQVEYQVPKEIKVSVPQPTNISVEGIDKILVGQIAAKIRDFKRPEPYKGKGIRYVGEQVRRKQGKSVTK